MHIQNYTKSHKITHLAGCKAGEASVSGVGVGAGVGAAPVTSGTVTEAATGSGGVGGGRRLRLRRRRAAARGAVLLKNGLKRRGRAMTKLKSFMSDG
jgi:hypothetical protein